jgi:hypothetical protein
LGSNQALNLVDGKKKDLEEALSKFIKDMWIDMERYCVTITWISVTCAYMGLEALLL